VPPREAGEGAERDRGKVGDGPVQQHGGGHLHAGLVASPGGQEGHQAELGDPDAAGGDWQGCHQPDRREGGEGGLPGHLGLGQAGAAQACQQDKPQGKVARHRSRGDPPATGDEQGGSPVAEAEQRAGDAGGRRPAEEPAAGGQRALQGTAGPEREGLAAKQQGESGRQGGEQGQSGRCGGDQAGIRPAVRQQDQQGQDGQAKAGEDIPDA
jgi:hypothetical protein